MALTGKQKRVLRSKGQTMDPVVFIGKDGINEASIAATDDAFHRRELIKVRVMNAVLDPTKDIGLELAAATGSEMAGQVGHTFLLYRVNPEARERIEFPK